MHIKFALTEILLIASHSLIKFVLVLKAAHDNNDCLCDWISTNGAFLHDY
jgi:hypothetical protein